MKPLRDELKYIITTNDRNYLIEMWRMRLEKDPHTDHCAMTPILSQYYDSPNLRFYEEKLDGIGFRNKVRLRTYGMKFEPGQTTFLEIKQRVWDKVRKVRHRIKDFKLEHLDPKTWNLADAENMAAFSVLVEKYRLRPSAQIWYQREAYQGAANPDLRVTFDSCVMGMFPGELLSPDMMDDPSRKLLPDNLVILEIKSNSGIPSWVPEGVRRIELIQQTVPKYVMGVEKLGLTGTTPVGVFE